MSDSLFDLSGRVALVTGTSRGLGQYFARALAKAGADLAITSRDKNSLTAFASEIRSLGREVFCAELDVRDHASIQRAIAAIEDHFGKIDILVNNAGCNIRKPALDVTWDDWNKSSIQICAAHFLWRRQLRVAWLRAATAASSTSGR